MSRPTDKTQPPRAASGAGSRADAKPGRDEPGKDTFGRFIGTLARLEGGAGRKGRGAGR